MIKQKEPLAVMPVLLIAVVESKLLYFKQNTQYL